MAIPLGLAIGAAAGQLGGGIYNIAAGAKQRREGEKLFEKQLEDLRSGKYDLTVSQAQRDVADLARQYGEQAAMTAERRGAAAQQAALFGLRGGDPRLAAMMPAQTRATEDAIQRAQLAGTGAALSAQQRLAGMEQSILTQNEQARRMLEQMQMQRGAAAGEAGRGQQVAGIGQIASLPADLATLYTAVGGIDGLGGRKTTKSPAEQTPLTDFSTTVGDVGDVLNILGQGTAPAYSTPAYNEPDPFSLYQTTNIRPTFNEDGGKTPMVTPGEFSHDTNPIDMVAEDGTKVGEVTGGELILNPDQSNTIEELVEKGDGEALVMYLRDLFEQPQFQES